MRVQSLDQKDPLEEGMAVQSSILAWRIPQTEEPGWLQSQGCTESDTTEVTQHAHTRSVSGIHQVFKAFHEYLIPQLFLLSFLVSVLISVASGIYNIQKLPLIFFNKCVCGKVVHTGKFLRSILNVVFHSDHKQVK